MIFIKLDWKAILNVFKLVIGQNVGLSNVWCGYAISKVFFKAYSTLMSKSDIIFWISSCLRRVTANVTLTFQIIPDVQAIKPHRVI